MCKAFKTNQSKSLHFKKAGRKLFPPKADGPEAGRSIGKARVFCILFGPPSEENKYESRKPAINWKEGFCALDFYFFSGLYLKMPNQSCLKVMML